jgi:hypothetical protein
VSTLLHLSGSSSFRVDCVFLTMDSKEIFGLGLGLGITKP